jgi:hypothetical protein
MQLDCLDNIAFPKAAHVDVVEFLEKIYVWHQANDSHSLLIEYSQPLFCGKRSQIISATSQRLNSDGDPEIFGVKVLILNE